MRERLPTNRHGVTHKAVIYAQPVVCPHCGKTTEEGRVKFFFTVGKFEDGRPAELFLHMDQPGTTLDGLCDAWATAISLLLQHGMSLEDLVKKFAYQGFEPAGPTEDKTVRTAKSIVDYVMRWMLHHCGKAQSC